ncbi:Secretory protein OPEL [Phytophthora megakarya]|uniref:glucan endo-1,3-beta-D-glucosidase n=1 Tax=Phytophthora megakarya TaxID=4795 RepID=A0A225W6A4_9STRA|nr:Secretory protein OPEL [Phytophthora megakarya]
MVKVAMPAKLAMATCLYAAMASAETVNFINKCSYPIELYHSQSGSAAAKVADIPVGGSVTEDVSGPAHMYRHGADTSATLFEMACDGTLWLDISIIPPLPGNCGSYEDCKAGNKTGFNVPMSVQPKTNVGKGTCTSLYCAADDKNACSDAYLFPADNTKTHSCPVGTEIDVTFCYANSGNGDQSQTQQQDQTQQLLPAITTAAPAQEERGAVQSSGSQTTQQSAGSQTTQQGTVQSYADLGNVKATYSYKGKNAGNVPGSYNRVTDLGSCSKESVTVDNPVGPMKEPTSMVFRGPCEIENIAVFVDTGNGTWPKVSSYSRQAGTTENLTFMNNKNIDYSGQNKHGPQGYASADGKDKADEPTCFGGVLDEASDPSKVGGGPGISTGTEINIMTGEKCNGDCLGFHGDNDYKGWDGGKKAFVTEVKMPNSGKMPNQPAMWMLNAQVLHSNQYGCNCRGMGPVGGCGELDIAEVIETNSARDKVTTHYYFYDGTVLSPAGDNFAPRSYDTTTVYVTLIDDSNDGLIKIVELEKFDFTQTELGSLYQQLVDCEVSSK